jgi:hypothetical protein
MISRVYLVYGALVLLAVGAAQYRGWSLQRAVAGRANPASVRANPGAYRSPYFIGGRTMRGK